MKFFGYLCPVKAARGPFASKDEPALSVTCLEMQNPFAQDSARRLNDLQQWTRSKHQEVFNERAVGYSPDMTGCHGLPVLWQKLPYISPTNLHIMPIGHAFLLGVVKDFFKAIFHKTSKYSAVATLSSEYILSGNI